MVFNLLVLNCEKLTTATLQGKSRYLQKVAVRHAYRSACPVCSHRARYASVACRSHLLYQAVPLRHCDDSCQRMTRRVTSVIHCVSDGVWRAPSLTVFRTGGGDWSNDDVSS